MRFTVICKPAAHSRSAKGAMAMPHPQSAQGAAVPKTVAPSIAMFCGSAGLRNLRLLGGYPGVGFLEVQRLLVEGSA